MQTLPDSNSDRLLFVLFSKLDAEKISDQSSMPCDVLEKELTVVVDHLLLGFEHWSSEEKSKSKAEVISYIATTDRDEMVTEIRRRIPNQHAPLGRRIVAWLLFCVGGLFVILISPFTLMLWLADKTGMSKPLEEDQYRPSQYQSLCEMSDIFSRKLWPDQFPPCYCCSVGDSV